jgi:hypothetical protein
MKNAASFLVTKQMGLETTAMALEREIHKLDRRGSHLAGPDYLRVVELKKQRLRIQDRIADLRSIPRH